MKKIISILLAAFIAVTTQVLIYAEEQNVSDLKYYENVVEALDIMHALGLYDEYSETNLNAEKEIKRGEFASFVGRLIKVSENNDENNVYYYDVPKSNHAFGAVNALTDLGVLNGAGDKLFRPDDTITQDEAVVVLIRALGYGGYAEMTGGFLNGYTNTAGRLKLFADINSNQNLNMGNMLIMFKNMLEIDLPNTDFKSIEYPFTRGGKNGKPTFLKTYYDCYFDEGMITAADKTYIYGELSIDDDAVLIGNDFYLSPNIDAAEFLGEEVKYLYSDDEDEKTLLWIKQKNKDNVLYLTEPENGLSFDNSTFSVEYFEQSGARTKRAALAQNVSVVYNGEAYTGTVSELFNNFVYSAKLIKSKGATKYDVIIVTGFYDVCVGTVNETERYIISKNGEKISLDEGDYDYLKICKASGEKADFSDIKKDVTLSISEYGSRCTVYISSETVSGKISSSGTDQGLTRITIEDTDYRVLDKSLDNKIKSGNSVVAHIDSFGYISYIEVNRADGFIAYLINIWMSDDKSNCQIKVFTEYGEVQIYDLTKNVKLDGKKCNEADVFTRLYNGGAIQNQIMLCKLNTNNEIIYIDTPVKESGENDATLQVDSQMALMKYYKGSKKMGKKILMDNNTIILSIPENVKNADDTDYMCPSLSDLRDDNSANEYNAASYKFNDEFGPAQVVLIQGYEWNKPIFWDTNIVVDSIIEGVNNDDEVVEILRGYKAHVPVEVYCREDYKVSSYVSPGDIVKLYRDNDGYLKNIDFVFKAESGEVVTNDDVGADNRFVTGYVTEINGNLVKFSGEKGGYSEIFDLTDKPILVFDDSSRENKINVGSIADIDTYNTFGDNCSLIAIQSAGGGIQVVVVYK